MKKMRSAPPPCSGALVTDKGHQASPDGKSGVCGICGSNVAFTIDVSARPVPRFHKPTTR